MGINRTPPLGLSRDQLATFLQDHEQIKAFENLFGIVESIAPDVVQQVLLAAGNAQASAIQALTALPQAVQDAAIACATSEARATQALQAVEALRTVVEMAALAPPPREFRRWRYGSFYDTTTQSPSVINTAKSITFNTTDLSRGVYIGSPTSRIYVDTEGIYDFQLSLQLDSTVSTDERFYMWFAKNGIDVPSSASTARLKGNNAELILSLNYFFNLKANDYIELMFSATNLGVQILYEPATAPVPAIPSVILTVNNGVEGVQ